jgi:hypothetical protein
MLISFRRMENAYYLKNDSCLVTFDKKLQFFRGQVMGCGGGGWVYKASGQKYRDYIGFKYLQFRLLIVITFNVIIQLMLSVSQRTSHLSQICTYSKNISVIICLLLSDIIWPKVITLSGGF